MTTAHTPEPARPAPAPIRPTSGIFLLAALVVAGAGLKAVSGIVGPLFLVLTLVITVQPIRALLVRRRVPQWVATLVAMLCVYALLVIVLGSVVWSLSQLIEILPSYSGAFSDLYAHVVGELDKLGLGTEQLQAALASVNLSSFTGVAQTVLNTVTSGVSLLAFMLALVVFVVADAARIGDRIGMIRVQRESVANALTDFALSVRKYWVVTTIFGFIVAVVDVVALSVIGVPLALAWGVLAFVTNYIPNIGFLLGLVPPVLIALLDGGVGPALAVVIAYAVINVVIQVLIQPRFTGDAVGITATVAFLSLIFWSFMLGTLGALLAVPATLLVKSLLVDHSGGGQWFGALINSVPDEPPPLTPADAPADSATEPPDAPRDDDASGGKG